MLVTGGAGSGEPVGNRTKGSLIRSRTRQAGTLLFAFLALIAALMTVATSATANPDIQSKKAQARAILAQIRQTDSRLSRAIEAYNYANIQLNQLDTDLKVNARHLDVARSSLVVAQRRIAARLRALYVNGGSGGAIEVILGAESLDDLLNRLDMVQRVGAQDNAVLRSVRQFRKEVETRRTRLREAREAQARVVSERVAQKQSIEGQLADRQRLLASVKDEISELEAEEARRQRLLEAQARARARAELAAARAERVPAIESSELSADPAVPDAGVLGLDAPPSRYGGVVGIAMQYLGVPYVWGGASPSGFDCSGFIMYVYAQMGVALPHHAASQYGYGTPVSRDQLEPGDLVFFDGLGHAGIYIGGGNFIHAPHTGDVVKISSLDDSWYASTWVGARRL